MVEITTPVAGSETPEKPTFNMGKISWKNMKQINMLRVKMMETTTADEVMPLLDQLQEHVVTAIATMPASWMVDDYPKDSIDWTKGEAMEYLRGDRFNDVISAFLDEGTTSKAGKN